MTKSILLTTLLLIATAGAASAAPAAYLTIDHSSQAVMDKATAQAIWKEHLPDDLTRRLLKLYPSGKYGFFSQVEGGFTQAKLCVVTARAMMLPRAGKVLQAVPQKTTTTFDAQPNLTAAQCQDLAKAKLREAVSALVSPLVAR
ncbi:MAG: hypothetical protein HUU30_14435 [Burkholderiaceae bacterium]|jgi:hypothetical protein|nr:hypothetical protein [Burkholderiaceae bacterium]